MSETIETGATPPEAQPGAIAPPGSDRRRDWRDSRLLAAGELGLVALIFIADWHHLVFFSKTLYILVLGCVSVLVRRTAWKSIGLTKFRSWGTTVALGVGCGLLIELFELFVSQPGLIWLTGKKPDLSDFQALTGNLGYMLIALGLTWTLAAFGEELVYRYYMMNRAADLGKGTPGAWVTSLVVVSLAFGLAHTYQGITGVVENALDGAILGWVYLRTGRNLSVPIIAHGVTDTVDVLLIFLGKYPTM
jgi:membrane protease YdiL (CAAX protease family)